MAIVPSPRHALDERGLAQQIEWLKTIASRLPYSPEAVLAADEPAAVIAQAQKLGYAKRVRASARRHHHGSGRRRSSALNYLRNNVLHAYALPALVANLLVALREATLGTRRRVRRGRPAVPARRADAALLPAEAIAESQRIVDLFVEMGLARAGADGVVRAADRYSAEHAGLELLARSLRHLLRRNYLTIALLNRVGAGKAAARNASKN